MRMVTTVRSAGLTLACLCVFAGARLPAQSTTAAGFTLDDVLSVRNVTVGDVSADGRWIVVATAALRDRLGTDNSRFGDPTYVAPSSAELVVIDTRTGERRPLFPDKRQARAFAWSPDGTRLAFQLREGEAFRLTIWELDRARLRTVALPQGRMLADNSSLQWSADGSRLLFGMRTSEWAVEARTRFLREIEGPIVVQSSEDPFLSWEDIRRRAARAIPAVYDPATGRIDELLAETALGDVALTADGALLRYEEDITKKTDYAEIFGREHRVLARPVAGGEARTLIASSKGLTLRWSGNGRAYVYAKEGKTYFGTVDGGEPQKLTGEDTPKPGEEPADSAARNAARDAREKERFTPVRLNETGEWLVATNKEGFWLIETASAQRRLFLAAPQNDSDRTLPRYEVAAWSRDGNDIYLTYASRTQWQRGIVRYDRRTNELRDVVKDGRLYSSLRLAADGSSLVLTIAEGNRPGDVYVADRDLRDVRRLTDANPGVAARTGRTELLKYLDADGDEMYGVVYYPLGYQPGTRVPTIFIVYEDFFDDRFNATISFLTSNGYAVVQPSVDLERGFPGEAWVKGVTAAANKLIDMGIADPKRLGVHGTSYGGYATNLLVTQTDRFAAAINISGKTDMISFYTDSPRLGTRNIHAPEKSQDRIGATLWEQPQKYVTHSAVMFADRIKTPLLLLTGREDHNVPERTTSEMFYALRRLGKRVEWVSYINGGHGMPTTTEAEVRDFHTRILAWYDRYLKPPAEPKAANGR
ncbi:MAG: S9 family peptidase [Gemmatimonadetes bacterium]|nr:S9 family peptidase [Gemmatimonadota bacterium]